MVTFITVEGIRVRARTIPWKQIVAIWKTLTDRPFPKVKAFQVEDDDFDHIVRTSKSKDDERREKEEWGKVLSPQGTDAFVYNADKDEDYLILVRENPYHNLGDVLEHELSHIARGDL